jgi:hypothetical protein
MFQSIAEEDDRGDLRDKLDRAAESHELIGEGLSVDHYKTITDSAKEMIRNG